MSQMDTSTPALPSSSTPTCTIRAPSFPTTVQQSCLVNDIQTDLVVQIFSDRTLILISQLNGKIGTYITTTVEQSIIDNSTTFNITSLLGRRDDPLMEIYARQLAERIHKLHNGSSRDVMDGMTLPPILLGIALSKESKAREKDVFHTILDLVLQMYVKALSA